MKGFIEDNYNIVIDNIYNEEYFFVGDYKYLIVFSDVLLNEYVLFSNKLYNLCSCSTFVLNKNNSYYSKYKDKFLYLIRFNCINEFVSFDTIISYMVECDNLPNYDIVNKWVSDIDDLEAKLSGFDNEYEKVCSSVDFYIGMAENAVSLLSMYSVTNKYLGSNVKYSNYNLESFSNPINFIKVNKYYNFVKYIKYCIYNGVVNYDLFDILNGLNEEDSIFVFAYMMYPDYYFEVVSDILDGKVDEVIINNVNSKLNIYIDVIKLLKNKFKSVKNINLIEWI